MSKSWDNHGGRSFSKGSSRSNNKSYKKKSNNTRHFQHRPYKIYPQLDDGTFYVYHYDIGFGANFKSINDIKKWLDCYDF